MEYRDIQQKNRKGILNKFIELFKSFRKPLQCEFLTTNLSGQLDNNLIPDKAQQYSNIQLSADLRKNLGMNEDQAQQLERVLALVGEKFPG